MSELQPHFRSYRRRAVTTPNSGLEWPKNVCAINIAWIPLFSGMSGGFYV